MSSCYQVARQITKYLDGELEGTQKQYLEQHVEQCSACRSKLEQVKLITKRLPRLPRYKTSPQFEILLRSRIRSSYLNDGFFARLSQKSWFVQVPAYASIAVLFVGIGFFLGQIASRNSTIADMMSRYSNQIRITPHSTPQSEETSPSEAKTTKMTNYVIKLAHPGDFRKPHSVALSSEGMRQLQYREVDSTYTRPSTASIENLIKESNVTIHF